MGPVTALPSAAANASIGSFYVPAGANIDIVAAASFQVGHVAATNSQVGGSSDSTEADSAYGDEDGGKLHTSKWKARMGSNVLARPEQCRDLI